MNPSLSFRTACVAAFLACLSLTAFGDSVATDPVGFITINISGGSSSSPTLSLVSPTLVNPVSWQGTINSINPSSITVSGTPWIANQFNGANGGYFVEVVSGANSGAWANITATATNSITVDSDLSSLASQNTSIRIRPHITLAQFLGANNTAGLQAGSDLAHSDQVFVYNGSTASIYWYYNGSQGGTAGWYDTSYNPAGGTILYPSQGIVIRRLAALSSSFQFNGAVKTGATFTPVQQNTNVIGSTSAADLTLVNSGLYTGNASTGMKAGPDLAHSDQITIYGAASQNVYWCYDGSQGGTAGWYDTSYKAAGSVAIKAGSSFVIKRISPGVAFNWTVPPVNLN